MCCFPASVVIFRVYKIVASGSENNYWILTHYLFSMTCWPADLNPRYTVSFKSIEVLCPPLVVGVVAHLNLGAGILPSRQST